jgi:hypothetical protein
LLERATVDQALKRPSAPFVNAPEGVQRLESPAHRLAVSANPAIVLLVVGSRMRRDGEGNAVRIFSDSAAAPATVSGEHPSTGHGSLISGKAEGRRRPASQETCRRH